MNAKKLMEFKIFCPGYSNATNKKTFKMLKCKFWANFRGAPRPIFYFFIFWKKNLDDGHRRKSWISLNIVVSKCSWVETRLIEECRLHLFWHERNQAVLAVARCGGAGVRGHPRIDKTVRQFVEQILAHVTPANDLNLAACWHSAALWQLFVMQCLRITVTNETNSVWSSVWWNRLHISPSSIKDNMLLS